MKISVMGPIDEVDAFIEEVSKSHEVVNISEPYPSRDIPAWVRKYFEIPSALQKIAVNIQEHQILEFCQTWHSKSDVMHFFSITYDQAEEILERMYHSGDLFRELMGSSKRDRRYEYKAAKTIERNCRNCRHCEKDWCDYHEKYIKLGMIDCRAFSPREL